MRLAFVSLALALAPRAASEPTLESAQPQETRTHEDPLYGYKLKPPKGWTQIPLQVEERWQTAKYLSERTYFFTERGSWTYEHRPHMLVIAFVEEMTKEKAEVKKTDDATVVFVKNPYKDYKDYLQRTYSEGGFYVAEERESELEGVPVTCLEIKVEKLVRGRPKRISAWIFHAPGVDFAVEFEVLESEYKGLEKTIQSSLRSFRLIPRAGALPGAPAEDDDVGGLNSSGWYWIAKLDLLSPVDRKLKRIELEKRMHAKALAALPSDWTSQKIGRFLVLCHGSDKQARRVVEQAESLMRWLDLSLPFVGPDEYVRSPIVRICKDWEEYRALSQGGEGWGGWGLEIITFDDHGGKIGWQAGWLNRNALHVWFLERDRELYFALPSWLAMGLSQVVENGYVKGSRFEFRDDDWERAALRERVRSGAATRPRDLMRRGNEKTFDDLRQNFGAYHEAGALVRFFVNGPGAKDPKTRDVLPLYLKNLKAVIGEIAAEEKAKEGGEEDEPATEEEEDAWFKKRQNLWKEKEQRVLQDVWERTFRSWTDEQWDAFEKFYFKSVG